MDSNQGPTASLRSSPAMIEFAILSGILGYLLGLAARKGVDHLRGKVLLWSLMIAGWFAGTIVQGLPSSSHTTASSRQWPLDKQVALVQRSPWQPLMHTPPLQ